MRSTSNDDSDLRGLLNDAVSDVHPGGGPEQIRARARRTSPGHWVPITLAAAVATVTVIGGAAWLAQRQPEQQSTAGPGTPRTQTTTAPDAGRTARVPVYYLGGTASGPRLFSESHSVTGATGTDLQEAVDQALSGSPVDPDYANVFRGLGVTAQATNNGGALTIDLSSPVDRPTGMNDERAQMALQSLVWTADAAVGGTGPVRFTVAGAPATEVLGVDASTPVSRAGGDSALSTVSISTPLEGATVPTRFEVTGQAATFEADVVWELTQGSRTVRHGFTTATECCTLSPYRLTVTAAPGDYTLVVHDTDESDGEGIGTSEDTKRIRVE